MTAALLRTGALAGSAVHAVATAQWLAEGAAAGGKIVLLAPLVAFLASAGGGYFSGCRFVLR